MKSIRELYKIGHGPSSSHTMGPQKAAAYFAGKHPDADHFAVTLYGSLAKTGRGHCTDTVILDTFAPRKCEILWDPEPDFPMPHENTMDLCAYAADGWEIDRIRVLSVGGGEIRIEGIPELDAPEIYHENHFTEIAEYCKDRNMRLSTYVYEHEDVDFKPFLEKIWLVMNEAIDMGLQKRGTLPGGLGVERKAQYLYNQRHIDESPNTRENRIVCAYAFAASEQNADGGVIVTAPTCGACSVVPSVLRYFREQKGFTNDKILDALAVGGLVGNLVKENASISGAACGCQAEIGTACSMAAAALCELHEMSIDQIEYAAEVALEHHLGLTCDPICGLVQIPCIERNAVAAMRAINALSLSNFLSETRKISFDMVVKTMYETGRDINARYRETSAGGLAKLEL
ncbi:MAG: L-serine ammonia-lyase, iron-sulfur-dependent, subunit alpha [Eubacteriales bacterium]|nr:L-serine ammonia-lyase, iron-sulfur-dependent, subunit alpha [Eubacteriales bacterium]MDY3940431.1 L-serine ammonia-lyase, iron-sulfur-dependent, subunit alpha [Eubacteriales bacterium]